LLHNERDRLTLAGRVSRAATQFPLIALRLSSPSLVSRDVASGGATNDQDRENRYNIVADKRPRKILLTPPAKRGHPPNLERPPAERP
jgi:hypothetical protein